MNNIVGACLLALLSTVLANVSNTGYAVISSRSVVKARRDHVEENLAIHEMEWTKTQIQKLSLEKSSQRLV